MKRKRRVKCIGKDVGIQKKTEGEKWMRHKKERRKQRSENGEKRYLEIDDIWKIKKEYIVKERDVKKEKK